MVDETYAALQFAGPASWHHLIAPTKTFPLTEATIHSAALSMDAVVSNAGSIAPIYALTDLCATSAILSNAIANTTFTRNARDVFEEARLSANLLDVINKNSPTFNPTFRTYQYFKQAIGTRDRQVLHSLLVDTIRVGNHVIKKASNNE